MKTKILYVERKPSEFVSIEKAFRAIASDLSEKFEHEFQQTPFGNGVVDIFRNLLFFKKNKADLYHITGHVHYLALLFPPKNTILSIMDVGFLYRRTGLRNFVLKKLFLDWPVRRMRHITAISEQTKREIVRLTNCRESKVTVLDLPLFFDARESEAVFNAKNPTILQVGTAKNKNVPTLIRALKGIRCHLKIIGRMNTDIEIALAECGTDYENGLELTDEQMSEAYRTADIVTYCSLYEGFGLPIIEGQAFQKPVVTSNITPLTDTAGNGAVLVDPLDAGSLRAGIEKIINDDSFRTELVRKGLENVERFSPRAIAGQYENYYQTILSELQP